MFSINVLFVSTEKKTASGKTDKTSARIATLLGEVGKLTGAVSKLNKKRRLTPGQIAVRRAIEETLDAYKSAEVWFADVYIVLVWLISLPD